MSSDSTKSSSKYVTTAVEIFKEKSWGKVRTRDLATELQARIPSWNEYSYSNAITSLRKSGLFDTSERGFVAYLGGAKVPAATSTSAGNSKPKEGVQTF